MIATEGDEVSPAQGEIQNSYLESLRTTQALVSMFLLSGSRLRGRIQAVDRFTISLADAQTVQLVFKSAISTIVPLSSEAAIPPYQRETALGARFTHSVVITRRKAKLTSQ